MYAQIMQGIRLLEQYEVAYNILTVLTPRLAAHPEAYYHFLKDQGFSLCAVYSVSWRISRTATERSDWK